MKVQQTNGVPVRNLDLPVFELSAGAPTESFSLSCSIPFVRSCLAVLRLAVEAAASMIPVTASRSCSSCSGCFVCSTNFVSGCIRINKKGEQRRLLTCRTERSSFRSCLVPRAAWKLCRIRVIVTSSLDRWVLLSFSETNWTSGGTSSSGLTNSTVLMKTHKRERCQRCGSQDTTFLFLFTPRS